MNDKIWNRYPQLRDNGVVSVGSVISVFNPKPITTWFRNDIPILEVRFGCIVMKTNGALMNIFIDNSITGHTTRSFVMNSVSVSILSVYPQTTSCSGHLCDKQRCVEIGRGNRTCGCYHMQYRIASVAIVHDLLVEMDGKEQFEMSDFSSTRFCMLYLVTPFDFNVKFHMLDATEMFFKIQDAIMNVVKYINGNGGFTVTGW